MMRISFTGSGWRDWQKLSQTGYAAKLTDAQLGQYRFRVGDYRIVFDVSGDSIVVLAVAKERHLPLTGLSRQTIVSPVARELDLG